MSARPEGKKSGRVSSVERAKPLRFTHLEPLENLLWAAGVPPAVEGGILPPGMGCEVPHR